jgi:hypothetical protein
MILSTPSAGHDPALPAGMGLTDVGPRSLDTIEGRIAARCGLNARKLRRNNKRAIRTSPWARSNPATSTLRSGRR